jgi:peptide/nickel transport system permease protein
MTLYLLRRIVQSILFIFLAWLTVYTVLVYVMPSGPAREYDRVVSATWEPERIRGFQPNTPEQRTAEQRKRELESDFALNRPWPFSFLFWLFDPDDVTKVDFDHEGAVVPKGIDLTIGGWRIRGSGILTGDFGDTAFSTRLQSAAVTEVLGSRGGNTIALVGASFLAAVLISIPIGIVAAIRQRSSLDHMLTFATFTGFSMPAFMVGTLLVIFFGVLPYSFRNTYGWDWMPYFPAMGTADIDQDNNIWNRIYHLVLPAASLALPQIAWLSRQVRAGMLEVMRNDYVRTAWAKGLPARKVVLKHTFRNALIPLITTIGLMLPVFISGAIMVETVFGYSGLGQVYFQALGGCLASGVSAEVLCPGNQALLPLDYNLALALTILIIVVVAFSNTIADLLYAVADPRINYEDKATA